jgi:hypothetical protein
MFINLVQHLIAGALATPTTTLPPAAVPPMNPDPAQLPGATVLTDLNDGLGGWALIAAMAGVVIGAVTWAFGHYSQNYQMAYNGRRGVLISAVAAILIGGAHAIIGRMFGIGGTI